MRIAFFSTKPYDKIWFEPMGKDYGFEIHFLESPFNEETYYMAKGYDAVCLFVNDYADDTMVKKLQDQGYPITLERVEEIAGGGVLGRPHIARALLEKGFGENVEDAFKRYLEPGKPGFLPRLKIKSSEAIRLARQAGGHCVLAHPKLAYYPDYDELLTRLKGEGLEGLEVYYPAHSDEEVEFFFGLAKKYDLFLTQGSDYHGKIRKSTQLFREQRGRAALEESVERLFARVSSKKE